MHNVNACTYVYIYIHIYTYIYIHTCIINQKSQVYIIKRNTMYIKAFKNKYMHARIPHRFVYLYTLVHGFVSRGIHTYIT
jgi:hypothetical protein